MSNHDLLDEPRTRAVSIMTTGDWLVTMLLTFIPIVGLVLLFVWAFSSDTNPNKANWAKATLIWAVILTGLYFLLFMVLFAGAAAGGF